MRPRGQCLSYSAQERSGCGCDISAVSTRLSRDQGVDEVAVLFPESAQLCYAEVFLVKAPADVLRLAARGGRVLILYLDQPRSPALRQC